MDHSSGKRVLAVALALPLWLGVGLNPAPAPTDDTGGLAEGYPTLDDLQDELERIAALDPARVTLQRLAEDLDLDPSYEGNDLQALSIHGGRLAELPTQLVIAGLHPREAVPPLTALALAERLALADENDPAALAVVEGFDTIVLPMANPDGWAWVLGQDELWRKNRQVYDEGVGVDLNRNFPFGWDGDCAGSTDPADRKYRGPSPGSEAETAILMALVEQLRPARILDLHGFGGTVKVGYSCCEHPLDSYLRRRAAQLSSQLGFDGVVAAPSAGGELVGWALNRYGAMAMIPELGDSFAPPIDDAWGKAQQAAAGLLAELGRPSPLSGHVTSAGSGAPLEARIELVGLDRPNDERLGSTPGQGRFDLWLPDGTWLLQLEADGHEPLTVAVDVDAAAPTKLDLALEPLAHVGGLQAQPAGCSCSAPQPGRARHAWALAFAALLWRRRQTIPTRD